MSRTALLKAAAVCAAVSAQPQDQLCGPEG